MLFILQAKIFPKKISQKFFWFINYLYIYISEITKDKSKLWLQNLTYPD